MKNKFYILVSFLIIFCSCGTNTESKLKQQNDDSINAALTKSLEAAFGNDPECDIKVNDSTFKGLFSAFCPNDTMQGVPFSLQKKYPFDTLITKMKDTTIYSFKVSNECCVKYYGKYFLSLDTLVLSYNYCGNVCDCYCDYILTYKIPTKKYKFKHIVLRTDKLVPSNTK